MSAERDAWITLAAVPGVGDVTFERLLERWGTAAAALAAIAAMPPSTADRRLAVETGARRQRGVAAAIRSAAANPGSVERATTALGGWILTPFDPGYPRALAEIEHPPRALFGRGDATLLGRVPSVAVVGTRAPTPAARHLAGRIATRLVEVGATVISGLAIGIDGAAHRAALDAEGHTVAVIGSGLDRPGPAAHRSLAGRIAEHGALVGELAPGVRASRGTYPRRNRIIAALGAATILVEAPARSGALITARHALEQGRELLVVPGRPFDRRIAGNLALLHAAPAIPFVGLDEMVVDLGLDRATDAGAPPSRAVSAASALATLGPEERAVAESLMAGPRTVDQLCEGSGRDAGVVAAALTVLQLRGWARVLGAMQLPAGPLLGADDGR